jgi:hypothetical protein
MPFKKYSNTLIVVLLSLIFIFVCARAVLVDMTHDEAYSFLNIKRFWYAQFLCNANSHWINSFGMWISSTLGFEKVWQLRWLSLASSLVILIIAFYWIRAFEDPAIKCFAFSLAFLDPFVLDYFMMARGYVSGMALEVLALFFFIRYFKTEKRKHALFALLCAGLSAIANFNYFYFFAAFLAVYNFSLHFKKDLSFLRSKRFYVDAFISAGFILLVLRALLFIKRCSNDFGLGDTGFIESIFSSQIDGLLYSNANHLKLTAAGLFLFVLIIAAASCGIFFFRKHNSRLYFSVSVITSLILILHIINHYCFGVLYPYYRGALFLFPLFVICIVNFFNAMIPPSYFKSAIFCLVSFALLFNFLRGVNFESTIDFYHQSESKECFELVERLGAKKVGLSHEHQGVYINYYQETDKHKFDFDGKLLNTYDADRAWIEKDKLEDFDHLILYPPYNLSYYKKRKIHFEGVTVFPITKTVILKVYK